MMQDTKMSLCTTKAEIIGSDTIEGILNRIKGIEFKKQIGDLRVTLNTKGKEASEYKKEKENLIGFLPSGIFKYKRSNKTFDVATYSKILVLDIDNLTDSKHVSTIKNKALSLENTFSVFVSPSGLGCKILVKVDATPDTHTEVYKQLMNFYNEKFIDLGAKCDDSCSDLSRLHYFSYDPHIKVKWDSHVFVPVQIAITHRNLQDSNLIDNEKIKKVEVFTQKKIQLGNGRNNYVLQLACNLNRFSVRENTALEYIVGKYEEDGFTEREILTIVKGVYKRYVSEFGKYKELPVIDTKKKYDYVKIREDLALTKLEPNQYFSLLFQSNENEEKEDIGLFNCLIEHFDDIYQFFNDEMLIYFANQIVGNQNFDNSIFIEDSKVSEGFQTLLNEDILPVDDRKRRILIADFKSEFLNLHYQSLLKQQPFQRKENIAKTFKELHRISELSSNQVKIAKALLEDCSDNPL